MNEIAAPHVLVKPRLLLMPVALLATAMLFGGLLGTAAAAPVGKDGKIHACYTVKGKPKGSLRILFKGKRCKRGERRVAWTATSSAEVPGSTGSAGQAGGSGQEGQAGAGGTSTTNTAALESKVASLALKVETLEDLLNGVTEGDLSGVLSTLNGVENADLTNAVDTAKALTNPDLTEALDSVPAVDTLCTQASTVTSGVNALGLGVTGISVLGLPGLSLNTSGLPGALDPFTCVTP